MNPSTETGSNLPIDSGMAQLLTSGGPVLYLLIVMSVIALCIFLLKSWQFYRVSLNSTGDIDSALRAWHMSQGDSALKELQSSANPIARVLEAGIKAKQNPNNSESLVREEVLRLANLQVNQTKTHLKSLELISVLSPLLGLLGTVLGMIAAFKQLESAGNAVDPAILSGGIWEALLTTAAGLCVAVPATIALTYLERKVETFKQAMENAMTQLFTTSLIADRVGYRQIPNSGDAMEKPELRVIDESQSKNPTIKT